MLTQDCKIAVAKWCAKNKTIIDGQFTQPLPLIEFLHLLDPHKWDVMCDDDSCVNHSYNTNINCTSSDTCGKYKEVVSINSFNHKYLKMPIGSIFRRVECNEFGGQLRGSIVTNSTDTKIINIEVHGE